MPLQQKFFCPRCGEHMARRPAGRCPHCGADVRRHVDHERERETRIEKVMAVISTILVVGLSVFAGGCSLVEGVVAYAIAGAVIWYWGRKTF
jgi:predicted RNA-binding Zn-ribbon protein involved in translation (DUF1610 family)